MSRSLSLGSIESIDCFYHNKIAGALVTVAWIELACVDFLSAFCHICSFTSDIAAIFYLDISSCIAEL